jgi:hypothetical protein
MLNKRMGITFLGPLVTPAMGHKNIVSPGPRKRVVRSATKSRWIDPTQRSVTLTAGYRSAM